MAIPVVHVNVWIGNLAALRIKKRAMISAVFNFNSYYKCHSNKNNNNQSPYRKWKLSIVAEVTREIRSKCTEVSVLWLDFCEMEMIYFHQFAGFSPARSYQPIQWKWKIIIMDWCMVKMIFSSVWKFPIICTISFSHNLKSLRVKCRFQHINYYTFCICSRNRPFWWKFPFFFSSIFLQLTLCTWK